MRRARASLAAVSTLVALGAAQGSEAQTAPACDGAAPLFAERAAELGLHFVHDNGGSGDLYFPEILGGAAALFDFDGDGDLDVYLVQGAQLGSGTGSRFDRLFRNDLGSDASGPRARFVDVTERAGIVSTGYGIGVATGDIDGDGHLDLFVANYGDDLLLRNRGDGTFEDTTARAGVSHPGWSAAATFFDADGDGDLDLFVVDYVAYAVVLDPAKQARCFSPSGRRDYCGPADFAPQPDRLYRNRGDGTFEDISLAAGIATRAGPGLGVLAADIDDDGDLDLLVANDGAENSLWLNHGDGRFEDVALISGFALNLSGRAEAGMGIDAMDVDGDSDLDVVLSHLDGETNTFYRNLGGALFEDRSIESGIGPPSLPHTGFGIAFVDADLDGVVDLLVANGAVRIIEAQAQRGAALPLAQPNLYYRGLAGGRFDAAPDHAGADFVAATDASRALVPGDIDRDGDLDVVLGTTHGPARLLINRTRERCGERRFVAVTLVDETTGGPVQNATVTIAAVTIGGVTPGTIGSGGHRVRYRQASDGSYGAARPHEVLTGVLDAGMEQAVEQAVEQGLEVRIEAPGKAPLILRGVSSNRALRIPIAVQ